jgi:cell division protein FtsQ
MPDTTARRRRAVALMIVVPMVLAVILWGLTYTPLFAARHIRIDGNRVLTDREVRSVAGISPSTNVVHLDAGDVVARLKAEPWVAHADVRTDLPNTLVVTIDERQPVGVISALGTTSVLASDGAALPVEGLRVAGLPVVRAALGEPTEDQRDAAAALLAVLDPVVLARVHEVLIGQDGAVTLTLSSGAAVDAGGRGEEDEKADALRAVLRWAAMHNVDLTSIDISSPAAPSVTLSDGSTSGI